MVKINGRSVTEGIDYTLDNGVVTILNKLLYPIYTISVTNERKSNRAERRKQLILKDVQAESYTIGK